MKDEDSSVQLEVVECGTLFFVGLEDVVSNPIQDLDIQ